MKQHPVPQQISSYQFRLVGDMTLKQFFQLAGGFLVALIIYATGLPAIIKWPLIFIFVLLGIALAFLPFKERPLSAWIVSFFRTIYSPSEFVWTKQEKEQQFFAKDEVLEKEVRLTNESEKETPKSPFMANLESTERVLLSQISQLMHGTPDSPPQQKGQIISEVTPTQESPFKNVVETQTQIPENSPTKVEKPDQKVVFENKEPQKTTNAQTSEVEETLKGDGVKDSSMANFSPQAAPPMPPETPNTIVGQIMDTKGKIVEGAIMEINDVSGRPVRALKTNAVGHFRIVTPLANGRYTIDIEKEGYKFEDIMFEAAGEIIPPIAIQANKIDN